MPFAASLGHLAVRIDPAAEPVDGVSFVLPVHNKAENLPGFHEELTATLQRTAKLHEIILVDDGSLDGSAEVMAALARPRSGREAPPAAGCPRAWPSAGSAR
jgi:hypothetical protein